MRGFWRNLRDVCRSVCGVTALDDIADDSPMHGADARHKVARTRDHVSARRRSFTRLPVRAYLPKYVTHVTQHVTLRRCCCRTTTHQGCADGWPRLPGCDLYHGPFWLAPFVRRKPPLRGVGTILARERLSNSKATGPADTESGEPVHNLSSLSLDKESRHHDAETSAERLHPDRADDRGCDHR